MQCFHMPYPPHYQGEDPRRPVHDQLGPCQSGPVQQAAPVTADRSHQKPGKNPIPRMEYCIKEKREEPKPTIAAKKLKADAVVQIGDVKVATKDAGKGPMVFGKSVDTPVQRPVMANDHEASSSSTADKYHLHRWCPPGLTRTQKRKLQRLRNKEKKEKEAKKMRDEHFNKYRPIVPQGKVRQVKSTDQPTGPV